MKINPVQQQNPNINNDKNVRFEGATNEVLRFLATNQAVGANGVDLCFMVLPRTGSDWGRRGPNAGLETLRREIMGTINNTSVGAYGFLAGLLLARTINKKFKINANEIMGAPETIKILAEAKANQIKDKTTRLDYLKETLKGLSAFNPQKTGADKDGFVKLSDKTIDEIAKIYDEIIGKEDYDLKAFKNKKSSNSVHTLMNLITEDIGTQEKLVLENVDKKIKSKTDLKLFLKDLFSTSKAFEKDSVKQAFEEQVKAGKSIKENSFMKNLLKFKKLKTIGGVAIAAAIGLSVQPINMYLTKKKTGQDGFVGVEGRTKDESIGFKALKVLSSLGFVSFTLKTMETSIPKFLDKMAFTGPWATIDQLKGIYGITIMSRLMSARDKDELRESLTKDFLGYCSWLLLGNYVNKVVAGAMNKSVINLNSNDAKKNIFSRSLKATLKTRDEVLIQAFKEHGISTVKENNVAKTFKEMMKDFKNTDKISKEAKKVIKKKLSALNWAQFAGYAFSGAILGFGIPNLNIYITNTLDKKRKAKAAKLAEKEVAMQNA